MGSKTTPKKENEKKVTNLKGNWDGSLGSNIDCIKEDNMLHLTIDLSQTVGDSASGKSTNVATTSGNHGLPWDDSTKLGINCYTKK